MPKYTLSPDQKEYLEQYKWLTIYERFVFEKFYRDGVHIEDIAAEMETVFQRTYHRRTVDRILVKLRNVAKMSHKLR